MEYYCASFIMWFLNISKFHWSFKKTRCPCSIHNDSCYALEVNTWWKVFFILSSESGRTLQTSSLVKKHDCLLRTLATDVGTTLASFFAILLFAYITPGGTLFLHFVHLNISIFGWHNRFHCKHCYHDPCINTFYGNRFHIILCGEPLSPFLTV